MLPHAEGIKAS